MMDQIEVDKSLYDMGLAERDIKDLWATDSFDSNIDDMAGLGSETDWTNLLDNQPIILHDRMMSDAVQSPRIQSEHSYSLTVGDEMPDSPLGLTPNIKLEDHYSKDIDNDCFQMTMSSNGCQSDFSNVIVKQEPASPSPSHHSGACSPPLTGPSCVSSLLQQSFNSSSSSSSSSSGTSSSSSHHHHHQQSVLKPPTILLANRTNNYALNDRRASLGYPKFNIKLESITPSSGFSLPPTPPSSTGSDSEGSLSPVHGTAHSLSPPSLLLSTSSSSSLSGSSGKKTSSSNVGKTSYSTSARSSSSSCSPLISNQPKGATGVLMLTEEEKRTLLAEGYPIPQRLPLTKAEERSLKKIRRKIKNKISAQESRRKKKEYMDSLEKRVEVLSNENSHYKGRVDILEGSNKSLLGQLQKLQALVGDFSEKKLKTTACQTIPTFFEEEDILPDDTDSFVHSVEMMELVDSQCR